MKLEPRIMDYVPRLECMARAKVAIGIYSNSEVTKFENEKETASFRFTPDEEWLPFLKERFSHLPLPERLQEMAIGLIKPLSSQHLTWKQDHSFITTCSFLAIDYFSWTSVGTIDYLKTAKRLIYLKNLAFGERFALASIYYLKDDTYILWIYASATERESLVGAYSTEERNLVDPNAYTDEYHYNLCISGSIG